MVDKFRGAKAEMLFKDESSFYENFLMRSAGNKRFVIIDFKPEPVENNGPVQGQPSYGWYRKFENNDKRPEMGCTKKRRKK